MRSGIFGLLYLYGLFFLMFVFSLLAETNRPPFDLPEAEGELVAGYNVEYSAGGFALFFIGEYANIILMSVITSLLFLGGWHGPFLFRFFMFGNQNVGYYVCFCLGTGRISALPI
jgi:NADH-quinone oxidoreductase subunit H